MDFEHGKIITEKKASILQGDKYLSNRVISRSSSVGCSSRIFYYRSGEGVPFQWEMQPGMAKDPPKEDVIPPLSPPPALLSLALPKPCIEIQEPNNKSSSFRSGLNFWKNYVKKIKILASKKGDHNSNVNVNASNMVSDKFEGLEFCSSDGEYMASSSNSSISSSSTSLSFGHGHPMQLSRLESASRESQKPYGCSPWSLNTILVFVSRRV